MEYTVIVPIFNEAESIRELCDRVESVFVSMGKGHDFEILFVDDGSTDNSRKILKDLSLDRSYLRSIFLRKNFGKSLALTAGFMRVESDFVITMDGDLQDRPEDIPKMVAKLHEDYDLISGWKQKRQDSKLRVWGSWIFNRVVSYFGGIRLHDFNSGFKVYRSKVIKTISVYGQNHRFIPLIAHFAGFKVAEIKISHDKRRYGVSRYPAFRYQGFFDLLSILFTYKYRFSPLYFFGGLGSLLIIPSGISILYLTFRHILFVLGIGENYMSRITLLLPLSTTFCLLGVSIFLTGFLCDFILFHQNRETFLNSVDSLIQEHKSGD